MHARFFDIQEDLIRLAAVIFLRALFAFPPPAPFARAPLHALTGSRPFTIEPHMNAVVLTAGRMSAHPYMVLARCVEADLVVQNRDFARLVGKILPVNQLVAMVMTGIGK